MGLSIHYRGRIKDRALILQLIEEVQDVCSVMGWATSVIDDDQLHGILFSPKDCEPVWMLFNAHDNICNTFSTLDSEVPEWLFTKTQYGGIATHMAVIKFIRHLQHRYLIDFELKDEGNYWETGDKDILRKQFERYEAGLAAVMTALDSYSKAPGDDAESLVAQLEAFLKMHFPGD